MEKNNTEKKKICLVIPSLQAGGMERVMSELASYFSTIHFCEVHLILYGIYSPIFYDLPENVIIYRPKFTFNNKYRFWFTLRTVFYLRKEVLRIKPDTILSFGELWNSLVILALLGCRYPLYISDRCRPTKDFGLFHNFLRKLLYPLSSGIVAQTQKAKVEYQKLFKHKNIKVIGNPIRFIALREELQQENVVISVGRLIDTKHFDRLIRVFYGIHAPNWKLKIIGGDANKQTNSLKLQNLISDLGLNDRVELLGTQKDVDSFLLKSKIFAFSSSSEGFPNVVGEALSAGLPVVSYDCDSGPSDMINDGENGFLIPVFDDMRFQEKLQLLIDDENLRETMGKKAIESMLRFFIENIGYQFLKFILPL